MLGDIMGYQISIIIPTYNVEKYIRQTLDSIVNQSIGLENLEVIIIDDCSTDNTREIIDEYAARFENFIVMHLPENSGCAGKPRNVGLENFTGDYVMFLDSDDYYSLDTCEILYKTITQEDVDVVFGNFVYSISDGTEKYDAEYFKSMDKIKIKTIDDEPRLLGLLPSLWTKLYKKELILDNEIKFIEKIPNEDRVFVLRAFMEANGIVYLPKHFGTYYRLSDEPTVSTTYNKKTLFGKIRGFNETFNILKKYEKEEYFPYIFKDIREFWIHSLCLTDAKPVDKKEVLNKVAFVFEEFKKYNVDINIEKRFIPLFNEINNKKYDEAILVTAILKDTLEEEHKLRNEINRLLSDNNKLYVVNRELKQLVNERNKNLAEYLSTHGYLKYKSNNIFTRLLNKLKNVKKFFWRFKRLLYKIFRVKNKKVVYTAITGDYDELLTPKYVNDDWDYICFTDNDNIKSDFWEIRIMEHLDLDKGKKARKYKVLPHIYLPKYNYSLWIDGNYRIVDDINKYIKRYVKKNPMLCLVHEYRDCIYEEAKKCIEMNLESEKVINSQINGYRVEGYPKNNGLVASGILYRKHNDPKVIALMNAWWAEINLKSRRDQLSFNYVCWKENFEYDQCKLSYRGNEFFEYLPHKKYAE